MSFILKSYSRVIRCVKFEEVRKLEKNGKTCDKSFRFEFLATITKAAIQSRLGNLSYGNESNNFSQGYINRH